MPGSVTNKQQSLPAPAGTKVAAGLVAGTGDTGLDGAEIPYILLKDASNPAAAVPLSGIAQDGTDSTDSNATQATAGVGMRGWLSTLVSLFRSGTAKVLVREVASTALNVGQLPITTTPTIIRSATPGRNVLTIRNISGAGGVDFYIGPNSSVSVSTGFPLYAASRDAIDSKWTGAVYGVTASGSSTAAFYEELA